MSRVKEPPKTGLKLEVTVIPAKYLDCTLAEIIRQLGTGPLLWSGGAGRAHGIKFVPCEIKKKRGRKPKPKEQPAASPKPAAAAALSV
ncbi:MAG: hypothetical protein NTW80_01110 [Deltaproteobacteria bacterium]|nr:hypothetical protein [Deltaproteobacteria bacterium]